jgi:hypothetical protein
MLIGTAGIGFLSTLLQISETQNPINGTKLPDVLGPDLDVVFCGTAAASRHRL